MPIACRQADPSGTHAARWFSKGSLSHFPTCLTIQELTPKRGSFPLKEKSNCQKSHFPLILEM